MSKIILAVVLLTLTGCSVSNADMVRSQIICSQSGGVEYYNALFNTVSCVDGYSYIVSPEKVKRVLGG